VWSGQPDDPCFATARLKSVAHLAFDRAGQKERRGGLDASQARGRIVAPYGEVGWVRNARAAGQVTLRRGRRSEAVSIIEVSPENAAPVLKKYLVQVPVVGLSLT
jgi:hypothetical protein